LRAALKEIPRATGNTLDMCRDPAMSSISGARREDAHTGKISLDTFYSLHTVSNGRRGHGGPI
jgi:hypothetical protein